jgi:hypothetical protein
MGQCSCMGRPLYLKRKYCCGLSGKGGLLLVNTTGWDSAPPGGVRLSSRGVGLFTGFSPGFLAGIIPVEEVFMHEEIVTLLIVGKFCSIPEEGAQNEY